MSWLFLTSSTSLSSAIFNYEVRYDVLLALDLRDLDDWMLPTDSCKVNLCSNRLIAACNVLGLSQRTLRAADCAFFCQLQLLGKSLTNVLSNLEFELFLLRTGLRTLGGFRSIFGKCL